MSLCIHLADRGILKLSGGDVKEFLQGIITVDIDKLSPENPLWAGLLSPQGKYLFDFFIYEDKDHILLDVNLNKMNDLENHLKKYILRSDVNISDGKNSIYSIFDKKKYSGLIFKDPRHEQMGYRIVTSSDTELSEEAPDYYYKKRIEYGICDPAIDMKDIGFFWPEIEAEKLGGIDYKKGCFVGQEVTARLKHKTELKKKVIPVKVMGEVSAPAKLATDMMDIGILIAVSGDIGLAYVRLDRWEDSQKTLRSVTADFMAIVSDR